VATADERTTVVALGIELIVRVVFVIVPFAFVCGIVSVKPSCSWLVSATASVAVFDWSPTTVAVRGGQLAASRATHPFGSFSTPLAMP
jgi:predicted branched-subunit amino acid permease